MVVYNLAMVENTSDNIKHMSYGHILIMVNNGRRKIFDIQ